MSWVRHINEREKLDELAAPVAILDEAWTLPVSRTMPASKLMVAACTHDRGRPSGECPTRRQPLCRSPARPAFSSLTRDRRTAPRPFPPRSRDRGVPGSSAPCAASSHEHRYLADGSLRRIRPGRRARPRARVSPAAASSTPRADNPTFLALQWADRSAPPAASCVIHPVSMGAAIDGVLLRLLMDFRFPSTVENT
jgi:hypothetical protein